MLHVQRNALCLLAISALIGSFHVRFRAARANDDLAGDSHVNRAERTENDLGGDPAIELANKGQTPIEDESSAVAEDGPAVVVDEEDLTTPGWNPASAVVQGRGPEAVYLRPAAEAFVDPDQKMSLDIKYYFPLAVAVKVPHTSLNRGAKEAAGARLSVDSSGRAPKHAERFPITIDRATAEGEIELEWLDYTSKRPRNAVLLVMQPGTTSVVAQPAVSASDSKTEQTAGGTGAPASDDSSSEASLQVLRIRAVDEGWQVTRRRADRFFPVQEIPKNRIPGGLLDAWDRPADIGEEALFVGRVIAVLKCVDDRYAIDFYGEALHEDSDCRVWLSPTDHAWGQPTAIRFIEIPIRRDADSVRAVSVLAVYYQSDESSDRWIAIDYPLCRSPMLEQLRRLAEQFASRPNSRDTLRTPELREVVGEELAEELERRLVNGVYR